MQTVVQQDDRVNISRLSVATGMTRKEVSALLSDAQTDKRAVANKSGQQRALRVLQGWLTDPRFQNRSGRPDELRYRGHKKSFALLVKLYGGDVTPKSVLRELERIEIVEATATGALRLRASRSRANMEVHYRLSHLARLFEDFALAAIGASPNVEAPSFLAFKDSTVYSTADAAYFMTRFSRRAAALLEGFQQWSVGRESIKPLSRQQREVIRVGLGVYLLRSDRLRPRSASAATSVRGRLPEKRHA